MAGDSVGEEWGRRGGGGEDGALTGTLSEDDDAEVGESGVLGDGEGQEEGRGELCGRADLLHFADD